MKKQKDFIRTIQMRILAERGIGNPLYMLLEQKEEKYPATCVVHWSTGPVNCCDKHARGLVALGNMLGGHVAVTKLIEKAQCSNCVNENKS